MTGFTRSLSHHFQHSFRVFSILGVLPGIVGVSFLSSLNSSVAWARTVEDCTISTKAGKTCSGKISRLRPTQMALGFREVEEKRNEISRLLSSPEKLKTFKKENPIPVVIGPAGYLYVIDHHHLARAFEELGIETADCTIVENSATLYEDIFWSMMEDKNWVYPFDETGVQHPISDIPKALKDLKDDPYRSLAHEVEHRGHYNKTDTPFAEFQWADFFRKSIPLIEVQDNYSAALREACEVAHSKEAMHLPGYKPSGSAKRR